MTDYLFTHHLNGPPSPDRPVPLDPDPRLAGSYTEFDPYYSASKEASFERRAFRRGRARFFRPQNGRTPIVWKVLIFPAAWFAIADSMGMTTAFSTLVNILLGVLAWTVVITGLLAFSRETLRRHPNEWGAVGLIAALFGARHAWHVHRQHEREELAKAIANQLNPPNYFKS